MGIENIAKIFTISIFTLFALIMMHDMQASELDKALSFDSELIKVLNEQVLDMDKALYLLNQGVNPDVQGSDGSTILHRAVKEKYPISVVAKILNAAGDTSWQNLKFTDTSVQDNDKNTPLHFAAQNGDLEMAKLLLTYGANPTKENKIGEIPLHFAVASGNRKIVDVLLKSQSDINKTTRAGLTPLNYAKTNDKMMMYLLWGNGAKNVENPFGNMSK